MIKLIFCFGILFTALSGTAGNISSIDLDGKQTWVYFNDGDTFKIVNGPLKGSRSRLVGFNALESYGSVHRWGTWTGQELYGIAKEATVNARAGGWKCTQASQKDIYDRLLVNCRDLAKSQIEKGLAHVMSFEKDADTAELIKLQAQAVQQKVGMWKKGSVDYILTSLHSASENPSGQAYDRFVSTKDGASIIKRHDTSYADCETITYEVLEGASVSSMLYVPYERRYGLTKAACL